MNNGKANSISRLAHLPEVSPGIPENNSFQVLQPPNIISSDASILKGNEAFNTSSVSIIPEDEVSPKRISIIGLEKSSNTFIIPTLPLHQPIISNRRI